MGPVLDALEHVFRHHQPLPAFVVDRHWNVRLQNTAAALLLGAAGDPAELMLELGFPGVAVRKGELPCCLPGSCWLSPG